MLGKREPQISFSIINIEELIPENHLLKLIDKTVNFKFIYKLMKPYYSEKGRPSIDPVCMIKMLLVGYLYGIKSERKLEEEVTLNLAYRWFCGFNMMDRIPDHSVFSQNRRRRFQNETIFREIFNEIIIRCIEDKLITGETVVSDGTFIPANVPEQSKVEIKTLITRSTVKYMDALDAELSALPGYQKPIERTEEKVLLKSKTDPGCGYIHQERKKGLGYLSEMTVDTKNGIITGVDCYPANQRESDIILDHIQRQKKETGTPINDIALDAGYDVGAVHRGLEIMNITGYCCPREMHNNALKKGFTYDSENDTFKCIKNKRLKFYRITYKKNNQSYYRIYRISRKECNECKYLEHCAVDCGAIRINASPFYPSYNANRERCLTEEYYIAKRLRSIWSEGTFAALKNQHNLKQIKKRGIHRAAEECLLAALALNLKRIIKALFPKGFLYYSLFFIN